MWERPTRRRLSLLGVHETDRNLPAHSPFSCPFLAKVSLVDARSGLKMAWWCLVDAVFLWSFEAVF